MKAASKGYSLEICSEFEWAEFLRTSPQANIFSNDKFLAALEIEHTKLKVVSGSNIIACAIIIGPNKQPLLTSHPYCLYQGIYLADNHGKRMYQKYTSELENLQIVAALISSEYPRHYFELHHSLIDARAFQWLHYGQDELSRYNISIGYTGIIDFDEFNDFDTYLNTIRSSRRQDLKRFRKTNNIICTAEDTDDLIELYHMTFDRQGIQVAEDTLHYIKRFTSKLLGSLLGKIYVARNANGQSISALFVLSYKNTSYYLIGATNPLFRDTGASTALLIQVMRDSYDAGFTKFDMVGLNSPNRGDFKTSFGAKPTPYLKLRYKGKDDQN